MRRTLAIALLAFCGLALAQSTWQTVVGPERKYSVDLPCTPQYSRESKGAGGEEYLMHRYLCEVDARAFVVQSTTFPPSTNVDNPRNNLQGGLDNAAKNMQGGAWKEINWTTRQGLVATDAIGLRNSLGIRSYSVMNGRDFVTLTYAGPPGSERTPDVERFVASLSISR